MPASGLFPQLPIPPFFEASKVGEVWRVHYQERAQQAQEWARQHHLAPASQDGFKIVLVGVDIQNTFCLPEFELYVAGRSGTGAIDDTCRLAEFIYRNLGNITQIVATMDTHRAMQIFHPVFLVNAQGEHPAPLTQVSVEDVEKGRWKFNPAIAPSLGITPEYGQAHLLHYTRQLKQYEKYDLTIWPYHSMLGGIGHALVSAFEEAVFFHTLARASQASFYLKGDNTLTESYSAIGPEVLNDPQGKTIAQKSSKLFEKLLEVDAMLFAGQAKSHCLAWTVSDLLEELREVDEGLARKLYLLEDCSSPVVVPGVVDYTEQANKAFERFAQAGAHVVQSTQPIADWPGMTA
jgi:nicotinamidase-related amidase